MATCEARQVGSISVFILERRFLTNIEMLESLSTPINQGGHFGIAWCTLRAQMAATFLPKNSDLMPAARQREADLDRHPGCNLLCFCSLSDMSWSGIQPIGTWCPPDDQAPRPFNWPRRCLIRIRPFECGPPTLHPCLFSGQPRRLAPP